MSTISSSRSPALPLLLTISFVAMLVCFWVCDDAYISFRYARNFARGSGLTYNPALGMPVEGFSNLLWVLFAALVEYVQLPPQLVLPYVSIGCALFLTVRIYRVLERNFSFTPCVSALLAGTTSLSPPFLIWASSGLATMPFALLIFLLFEYCFYSVRPSALRGILICTSLVLIRAEGFAWGMVILTLALLFAEQRRHIWRTLIPALLITIGMLFLARYMYYGHLMPNTASAKVGFSLARLYRGVDYVAVYLLTFLVPLLTSSIVLRFKMLLVDRALLVATALFLGFFCYAVLVGGDYMSMGRFLVPGLAFQALILGAILQRFPVSLSTAIASGCIIIGALPLAEIYLVPHSIRSQFHFRLNRSVFVDEFEHWQFMKKNAREWRTKGEYIARFTEPGESLVEGAIGNVGYFSDRIIFDRMGLVSKIPHSASPTSLRSPGHDLRVPAHYFLPQKPTYLYARAVGNAGIRNLHKQKSRYPFPYAPKVYDLKNGERHHYFVLMKRHKNADEYNESWQTLKSLSATE